MSTSLRKGILLALIGLMVGILCGCVSAKENREAKQAMIDYAETRHGRSFPEETFFQLPVAYQK